MVNHYKIYISIYIYIAVYVCVRKKVGKFKWLEGLAVCLYKHVKKSGCCFPQKGVIFI